MKKWFQTTLFCMFLGSSLCVFAATATTISLKYNITGIKGAPLNNANARLQAAKKDLNGKPTQQQIQTLYSDGPNQIKQAIEPFGYFKASVSSQLTRSGNKWIADYKVNPGRRLHITRISVNISGDGKNNKKIMRFLNKFPIKTGHAFNTETYEKAKNKLLTIAQGQGYLRAQFINTRAVIHLQNYTCIMTIEMNTGPRFYYGDVTFSKTPLSESFLRRYLNFKKGQPLSYSRLLNLQQQLSGAGYFESVSVVPLEKKTKKQAVPIKVNLKMRKRKEYRFGVGYGTSSGPRGTIGYGVNWLNRYGHKFKALMQLSAINSSVSAQYLIPGKRPAHENYAINGAIYQLRPKRGKSIVKSIGVAQIKNYSRWQRTIGLTFEREQYNMDNITQNQTSKLLFPSITFSRTKTNNILKTKNGYNVTINLLGTSGYVVSTASLIQAKIDYTQIFTLFRNNRFVIRGDYGYDLISNLRRLPLSKYFYTGGINSIRGYRYQDIGPGRFLVVGSAEYQRRVYGNWYVAVFYDIGNAMNHFNEEYKRGTGAGIVWQSPIGALRMYVSRALTGKDHPLRFDFSFGPDL